eukprot:TRINITY_DN1025_c0_g1_i1.p1 TRINITY_DN1025_c0_g1~~TRINITY_DN1025_c0_g1_i1.p1  ORF type:complete len:960 (+),score=154.59 TRINITY_DN1025_c0_g1_i1:653-3532(+)
MGLPAFGEIGVGEIDKKMAEVAGGGGNPSPGLPCPGFEGYEKRLEVEFGVPQLDGSVAEWCAEEGVTDLLKAGLRAVPRDELDAMLAAAACTIVSHLPNEFFDSYVLSESSLFIYANRAVIKTCGTTKLLSAIPNLLESAARLSLVPRRCKYTRGTFLFPDAQPAPYNSFAGETQLLEKHFGHLGGGGKAFVLGDTLRSPNWHVYVADAASASPVVREASLFKMRIPSTVGSATKEGSKEPLYTLEMCMTKLDRTVAKQFFQEAKFASPAACTKASGIGELLPKSQIDDFLFEPCGYSMNGIEDTAHSTIHITPEDGFSYASFEAMGYGDSTVKLSKLVKEVLATFKPGSFSLALHCNAPPGEGNSVSSWAGHLPVLEDFVCDGTSRQDLPLGSSVVFHTYTALKDVSPGGWQEVVPLPLFHDVDTPRLPSLPSAIVSTAASEASFMETSVLPGVVTPVLDTLAHFGPIAAAAVHRLAPELVGHATADVDKFISSVISATDAEEPFYVFDLGIVMRLWKMWSDAMPRVTPFYAVKCNPDPALLTVLASLGTGFDVASKAEMEAVTAVGGVSVDRMIYANPCKLPSHIAAAAKANLRMTTFDSVSELRKLKKHHPNAEAVLRLRADDKGARCPLGVKYGADADEWEELLVAAKDLGVHVAGVAFHVGSGASDPTSFADGIKVARSVFDRAAEMGLSPMTLLDIGGGFTSEGGHGMDFLSAASAINAALDMHFPEEMGVRIIGEPGRFFAESPATLATHVFGTRFKGKGESRKAEYWINDGIYGSMNCLLFDHAVLSTRPLAAPGTQRGEAGGEGGVPWKGEVLYPSTVFGPTCDGLDTVMRDVMLPEMDCGDWLVFPRMGAYTQAAGSAFNGFSTSDIRTRYVYSPCATLSSSINGKNPSEPSVRGVAVTSDVSSNTEGTPEVVIAASASQWANLSPTRLSAGGGYFSETSSDAGTSDDE